MLRRLTLALGALLQRGALDREMRAEMEMHLEQATERLIARGMSPAEARLAARREFGNVGWLREEGRRARGGEWIGTLTGDVRFALRQFARTPLTSGTIILVLSLGIGANVALFGILHSLTMRPPPGVPSNDGLVRLQSWYRGSPGGPRSERPLSYAEFQDYAAQLHVFSDVAGWTYSGIALATSAQDEGTSGSAFFVTGNYFDVLGVRPVIGAGLPRSPPDRLAPDLVAVISYALWEGTYSRAPDVLGRTITVNDVPVTIVGVAPPMFAGATSTSSRYLLWLPLGARSVVQGGGTIAAMGADSAGLHAIARLAPDVDLGRPGLIVRSIAARHPWTHNSWYRVHERSTDVAPLRANNTRPDVDTEEVAPWAVLAVMAILIVGVTCATVSTLLVGIAVSRRREIAVRVSLGATRGRILRQLLTESALLATTAALVSLGTLWTVGRSFQAAIPTTDLALRWQTIVFAFGFGIGTVILFGLSPALHALKVGMLDALKATAAPIAARSRLQKTLVVAQIALSQPLLLGLVALAALIVRDHQAEAGRTARDRIVLAQFNTRSGGLTGGEAVAALRVLEQRLAQLPGVVGVVGYTGGVNTSDFAVHPADRVGDRGREAFSVRGLSVAANYFDVLDIPVIQGRGFRPDDIGASPSPVIIGSDLAQELWGDANPVGRRFLQSYDGSERSTPRVVIGVVDARRAGPTEMLGGQRVFYPMDRQREQMISSLYVRTRDPADPLIPAIRALARAEAPRVPIGMIETLAADDARDRASTIQASSIAAGGGLIALLLSSVGLYAVVAFAVAQRTREIGIRMALGARHLQVVSAFFRAGVRLSLLGLAIGLPIGLLAVHLLVDLVELPTIYLPTLAASVGGLVIVVASLATWLPARRAALVDPLVALRSE